MGWRMLGWFVFIRRVLAQPEEKQPCLVLASLRGVEEAPALVSACLRSCVGLSPLCCGPCSSQHAWILDVDRVRQCRGSLELTASSKHGQSLEPQLPESRDLVESLGFW